jgi:hypothetical protein
MIFMQDGQIMPTCCHILLSIRDGHLSTYRIRSDGRIIELMEGTVVRGKFHVSDYNE